MAMMVTDCCNPKCRHSVLNHRKGRCIVKGCTCRQSCENPQRRLEFGVQHECEKPGLRQHEPGQEE